jgi:hypothetical protein
MGLAMSLVTSTKASKIFNDKKISGLVNLRPPTTVFFKRQAQLSDKRN